MLLLVECLPPVLLSDRAEHSTRIFIGQEEKVTHADGIGRKQLFSVTDDGHNGLTSKLKREGGIHYEEPPWFMDMNRDFTVEVCHKT